MNRKEIPILFNAQMVQAILRGDKTQTRREIKTPAGYYGFYIHRKTNGELIEVVAHDENERTERPNGSQRYIHPIAQPGDLLYVRETWTVNSLNCWAAPKVVSETDTELAYYFKAGWDRTHPRPWKPSIHMPKEAARIWLEVESVRVERLQDISEEDAVAEGVEPNCPGDTSKCPSILCREGCASKGEYRHYLNSLDGEPAYSAVESFESLWQSVYGAESCEANPWVWVVSFKVLSTTGKPSIPNPPHGANEAQ